MDSGLGANQHNPISQLTAEGTFSLSAWMKNAMGSGKKLLGRIWGEAEPISRQSESHQNLSEQSMSAQDVSGQEAAEQTIAEDMLHTAEVTAAASNIQPDITRNNPYFTAMESEAVKSRALWQRMRVRFEAIAGYLTRQFSGKDSFLAGQEKPGQNSTGRESMEDLRKKSRYRGVEEEIDCILTDDSYLLDSYDKKGEYTKIGK